MSPKNIIVFLSRAPLSIQRKGETCFSSLKAGGGGTLPQGIAQEFIYHIIPLVSRNQETHFPPHLQFGVLFSHSVPAPTAKESTYGCRTQSVQEEGPLCKDTTLETKQNKPRELSQRSTSMSIRWSCCLHDQETQGLNHTQKTQSLHSSHMVKWQDECISAIRKATIMQLLERPTVVG